MSRLPKTITVGRNEIAVPVTLIDRMVNWRDPIAGAARWQARAQMAIAGGYTAADRTRRVNQKGYRRELSAASAISPDLIALREDSQEMERNNAIAGGALALNVTKVVGKGLYPKAQIDRQALGLDDAAADAWEREAEREYRLATNTREIDLERGLSLDQMQAVVFLRTLADGDILINLPRKARPGSPYKLKLQMIEAARLCNPEFVPDTRRRCAGVEVDADGAPITYHVCSQHPGNARRVMAQGAEKPVWSPLKAFDSGGRPLALHLFDKRRPGQPRGVPYLTPVLELIKQLGRYTDAEVMAAVVSSFLTVVITNDDPQPEGILDPAPTAGNPDGTIAGQEDATGIELGSGTVVELTGNKTINTVNPTRPNTAFDPFVISILRQIGMALELPFEVLVKHFTSSYSAARGALEEAWDYFMRRRHWLAQSFCQPVYEAVITEAIALGRLQAPGFFADPLLRMAWLGATWHGDAPSSLDPVKEITAAEKRINLRLTTRSEERARLVGGDWEAIVPQISREEQALRAAELIPEQTAPKTPSPGDQSDAPA